MLGKSHLKFPVKVPLGIPGIWTSCTIGSLTKVLKLPKTAARVILKADTRDNSVELFTKLGWLAF